MTDKEVVNQTAKIEELSLRGLQVRNLKVMDSFDAFDFVIRVKNTSDHFFKAVGQLTIANTFGRIIATLPLRQDNILAQSTRQLVGAVPTVSWQPVFPLGRYTATAEVTPQNSQYSTSHSLTFYDLPYKAILALILVIVFYYKLWRRKI